MANHEAKSLEGILSLLSTGTKTYPNEMRDPAIVLDLLEEKALATTSNYGAVNLANFQLYTFDGVNGAGACTAVGTAAGDLVLSVACVTDANQGEAGSSFETVVTTADEIQQSDAGDLSARDYVALVYRP